MFNPLDMTGKKIIVAGASSGIGQATAIYLSRLGAQIALIARNEDKLKETVSQMDGSNHHIYCYDFYDLFGIQDLVNKIVGDIGPLSGMSYCVGISSRRPLSMIKPNSFDEVLNVCFYAYIEMVRCMTKRKNMLNGGSIVAISSIQSIKGSETKTLYAVAKSAMDAATRCMAKELSEKKIRLNTIRPAWVNTKLLEDYLSIVGEEGLKNESIYQRMLLGTTEPEEVAALTAFLLSNATRTITGASYHIDSGASI